MKKIYVFVQITEIREAEDPIFKKEAREKAAFEFFGVVTGRSKDNEAFRKGDEVEGHYSYVGGRSGWISAKRNR